MAYSKSSSKKKMSAMSGPSFQRRTKPDAHKKVAMKKSNSMVGGKTAQHSGRDMAKKYMQPTQKSSSARITANVWGTGKVMSK